MKSGKTLKQSNPCAIMMLAKKTFQPVQSGNVCEIYNILYEQKLVSFPLTKDAQNKVDALVTNLLGTYFGNELYPSAEEKAIAYLYFIIKDHPFTDGNKRTATVVFEVVCA